MQRIVLIALSVLTSLLSASSAHRAMNHNERFLADDCGAVAMRRFVLTTLCVVAALANAVSTLAIGWHSSVVPNMAAINHNETLLREQD
jgi:hypothetical protein